MSDYLPSGKANEVLYPDGIFRNRPRDGEYFIDSNKLGWGFRWDDLLGEWIDHRGDIYKAVKEEAQSKYSTPTIEVRKTNPDNPDGCECGAWVSKVDKHSTYCKLYRERQWRD